MAEILKMNEEKIVAIIDKAIKNFEGQASELEAAIGCFMLGRHLGWKPLFLMHSKSTIKKYETIIGIPFRDLLEPEGKKPWKSVAWNASQKITNFWKAVTGNVRNVRTLEMTKG